MKPVNASRRRITMSISSCTRDSCFSRTIIANTEVPADTFPERGRTALVATMPVPASLLPDSGVDPVPTSPQHF